MAPTRRQHVKPVLLGAGLSTCIAGGAFSDQARELADSLVWNLPAGCRLFYTTYLAQVFKEKKTLDAGLEGSF